MHRASVKTIRVGQLGIRFLVESADSNGAVTVFECHVPANAKMPAAHSHDAFEETIYGLEGVSSWTIDGKTMEIAPGDAVCIARGAVHGFDNPGSVDSKFLAVVSPGVFGPAYFRELGDVLAAAGGGPPDRGAMVAVMRRHGLTPAAPATNQAPPRGPKERECRSG